MATINELTRHTVTLDFTDENGADVIPGSITWRIDDPDSGAVIVNDTVVQPAGPSHQIVISAAQNTCSIGGKDIERRRLTAVATDLVATEYIYMIRRLKGLV